MDLSDNGVRLSVCR